MAEAAAPPQDDTAPAAPRKKRVYTQLWFWVLVGITLGIVVGLVAPGFARQLKIFADLFIQLIKVVIGPVIFCTVIVGIASLGNLARAGGLALRALGYFFVATVIALFLGLLAGNVVAPGSGFQGQPSQAQIDAANKSVETGSQESGLGAFLQNELFPMSFLQPFVDNKVLQVLVLAILTACSISFLPTQMREKAVAAIDGIAKVIFGIIKIIMWAAPLAAFGGMAFTVAAFGASSLANLGMLMLTFWGTCAFFIAVVLGSVSAWAGFNIFKLIRLIKDELLIIVGTSSSETVLPRFLTKLESAGASAPDRRPGDPDRLLVQPRRHLHLPHPGRAVHHPGGRGAAGGRRADRAGGADGAHVEGRGGCHGRRPGDARGVAAGVRQRVLQPEAIAVGIALIVGIDRVMSEGRALTNAIGNCVATLVIARWNGELDRERLRAVLDDPSLVEDDMELHHGSGPPTRPPVPRAATARSPSSAPGRPWTTAPAGSPRAPLRAAADDERRWQGLACQRRFAVRAAADGLRKRLSQGLPFPTPLSLGPEPRGSDRHRRPDVRRRRGAPRALRRHPPRGQHVVAAPPRSARSPTCCSTSSTDSPPRPVSARIVSSISATTDGWMPSVGSSRISSRGSVISARAMASCWRCPPESRPGAAARAGRAAPGTGPAPRRSAPARCARPSATSCRFSAVVSCPNDCWPCGT